MLTLLVSATVGVATPAMAAKLQPPRPVTATVLSATEVEVSWSTAIDATSYEVRRATVSGGPYTLAGTATGSSYVDRSVAPGTTYHYVVRSKSGSRVSGDSDEVTIQTTFTKPVQVRATGAENAMTLRWKAVPGAVRYEIIRLSNDNPVETLIGTSTTPEYVDSGLAAATRYVYWIRAVAANGASGTSDAIRVYTGGATTVTMRVSPGSVEQGQQILLIATVRYADGRIPTGEVAFMSDAGAVAFATVDGHDGIATARVSGEWTPKPVFALFQGSDYGPAGASWSDQAIPVVTAPYGSMSYVGPSWLEIGSWEEAVATGDLTGDGLADVVLTTTEYFDDVHDHSAFLFVQEAGNRLVLTQQMAMSAPSGGSMYPAIGDVDDDGVNELIVASGDGVDVFRQTAAGLSAAQPLSFGDDIIDVAIRDIDGDGATDIIALSDNGVRVRYGDGKGGFTAAQLASPHRGFVLELSDLAGDGKLDLVVQLGQLIQVSEQSSPRTFAEPVQYQAPAGYLRTVGSMAVGDVTGDAKPDVVVTVSGNPPHAQVQVLTRDETGALGRWIAYPVYDIPDAVVIADMNNDGRNDVAVTHGGWRRAGVLLQRPDGWLGNEFLSPQLPPASSFTPRGLAVADINNDGLKDLVMANYNAGLVVVPQGPAAASTLAGKGTTAIVRP